MPDDSNDGYTSPFWSSLRGSFIDVTLRGGKDERKPISKSKLKEYGELFANVTLLRGDNEILAGSGAIIGQGNCEVLIRTVAHTVHNSGTNTYVSEKNRVVRYKNKTLTVSRIIPSPNYSSNSVNEDYAYIVTQKKPEDCKGRKTYAQLGIIQIKKGSIPKAGLKVEMACIHFPLKNDKNKIWGKYSSQECLLLPTPKELTIREGQGLHTCDTNNKSSGCSILIL